MFTRLKNAFYFIPTPVAGLALGIASLGIGLENSLPLHSFGQILGALLSMTLVALIVTKFVLHPKLFNEELRHPVLGSIIPCLAMALMLQSKSLGIISPKAAEVLWLVAVALHMVLLVAFIYFRMKSFSLQQMVPSWFVPFVGISVAAISVPSPQYTAIAYYLMVFGMVNYAVMLPFMSYRLIFSKEIADPVKPTIAILAAPASLSLVAYLSLEQDPSLVLCSLLFGIAVLMTCIVYLAFFKLLRLPFSPSFAAYTFPMAVGATALYKVSEWLANYSFALEYSAQIRMMAVLEMIIATIVVAYVCFCYLLYCVRAWAAVMQGRKAARLEKNTCHSVPMRPILCRAGKVKQAA